MTKCKKVNIRMINTWKGTGEQEFYLVPSSSYQRDSQAAVKILQIKTVVLIICSSWVNEILNSVTRVVLDGKKVKEKGLAVPFT